MNNADFDYSYHYAHWHNDTEQSRAIDIANARYAFKLHSIFPCHKQDRVLEIGCAFGRTLLMLREEGFKNLVGIDIDKSQVEVAKKEGLEIYSGDAEVLIGGALQDFSAVYAFDVLEHIPKSKQLSLLKKVACNLKQDGFIVLAVPNALAPLGLRQRYIDFTHTIAYTPHSLGFLLHNAGLHYFEISAQYRESLLVRRLKRHYAKLVRYELGEKEPILTLNLFCVAFKDEAVFLAYKAKRKRVINRYGSIDIAYEIRQKIRAFLRKIPFLRHAVRAIKRKYYGA